MKLITALTISVFTLGATGAMAERQHDRDDYHQDHRYCKHDHARRHHKQVKNHFREVRRHHRIANRHQRPARHDYRNRYNDADYGKVVHVEPVYRYYKEPVNAHSCIQYDQRRSGYSSHTATVLGAVIGGTLGHRIGDSHGDPKVAAVAGGVLGASLGRDIDQRAAYNRGLRVEGPCRVRHSEETRRQLVEYKVSYRYNGAVHHARMDYDPGEWVKLDVNITPA